MRKKFDIMDHHDVFTDYSGQKVMLTTKLGGIPYLSITPYVILILTPDITRAAIDRQKALTGELEIIMLAFP